MTFGERALKSATIAAQVLGWRPVEFWGATPQELETALGLTGADPDVPPSDVIAALRLLYPDE